MFYIPTYIVRSTVGLPTEKNGPAEYEILLLNYTGTLCILCVFSSNKYFGKFIYIYIYYIRKFYRIGEKIKYV